MNQLFQKKMFSIMISILVVLNFAPAGVSAATSVQARPTSSSILVNGTKVTFEAYNINDNNYFKLRDVAMAFHGSGKQFQVTWDGVNQEINIMTNQTYIPVGGELSLAENPSMENAVFSSPKIYIDGKETSLIAFNIEGY